jgi:phosphoribosylglycinamide formyltransferase-1
MASLKIGVLISGRGSNLQAIHEAIQSGTLQATIAVVVSNKKEAPALTWATAQGLPCVFHDPKPFSGTTNSRESYDRAIVEILWNHGVDLVILAGYMRIVTTTLINAYEWKIMNIHPSLLPAFPGLSAQQQALEWGVKVSGCTVHFVTEGVDEGPIILQAALPVSEDETVESLSARILKEEHRIYSQAIQLYAEGRLQIDGRQVKILPQSLGEVGSLNPNSRV